MHAGPLLSIDDFGATAMQQIEERDVIKEPSHTLQHAVVDDQYTLPEVTATPLFRGIVVEQYFILNLCCGHRRSGDILDLLTFIVALLPVQVWVISVDIISGNASHDLTAKNNIDQLRSIICKGFVHGSIIGPPCETWTEVRYRILEGARRGPRPLRDALMLWGLPYLSLREYRQIQFGNVILQGALSLFADSVANGVPALVEHPAEPTKSDRPSIFRCPAVKRLLCHPAVMSHYFRQGLLGQASPKPTRLLSANANMLTEYIKVFSIGKGPQALSDIFEADGSYATAKLKAYPPRMNAAIIATFVHCILSQARPDNIQQIMFTVIDKLFQRCFQVADSQSANDFGTTEPCLDNTHPLHDFVQWPDKDAKMGPDFAFANQ